MANVRIVATTDGPHMVVGAVDLEWPSGHSISQTGEADKNGAIYLCRCGASKNKTILRRLAHAGWVQIRRRRRDRAFGLVIL